MAGDKRIIMIKRRAIQVIVRLILEVKKMS